MNVTEFVELWAQGDTATNFFRKQVLLVIGQRDYAKDNFIKFLARNESGRQIKDPSTSFKPTLVPVEVHSVSSNVIICDFDSFDDFTESGSFPLGVSSTYILQKVINSTNELQIILLVNFSSTKHGIDKHHFTAQIRKIGQWIKNIDNYANSIGLIVTNVANAAENQAVVDFDQILNHVETFLEQLRKENSQNLPMLKLLNILLRKTKSTDYERIGIFRQPNNQIPSNQQELVKKEWMKIRTLLDDIQFSPTNINDFSFYPQKPTGVSTNRFTSLIVDELDERIAKKINAVFEQLQSEFEKDVHNDFAEARLKLQKMDSIQETTPTVTDRNAREVLLDLESKLNKLNIHLPQSFLDDTFRLTDYLQFYSSVDSKPKLYEWRKAMDKITDYIRNFHQWNNFLREMDSVTSSYAVQRNSEKLYNIFINKPITELKDERLQQFVKDYYNNRLSTYYNNIINQKFSSLKILSLESIFKSNLKPGIVFENNNSTGVSNVFGEYIFLSDVISKFPNQTFLSINAASKIFIDTNITRNDNNLHMLSVISPVWELPAMQNVQIILDGRKGYTSIIYSGRSDYSGGTGDHGQVGHPGKSAGHFFGVVDSLIHHGNSLLISANGGKGGNGTNGGEGGRGRDGDTAATKNCERTGDFDSFQREELGGVLYHDYCVYGRRGGDGGRGGNGGVGAEGGFAGDITLIGFEKETKIQTSHVDGRRGENGEGGAGGKAGENGKSFKITKKTFWWGSPQCNDESYNYCGAKSPISKAADGARGLDAYRRETLQNPVKIEHPYWSSLLSTYRKYLLKDVPTGSLNDRKLSFLEKLNKNLSLIDLDTATSLADEFFYLDTQYRMAKNVIWVSYFEQLLYRTEHYLTTKHSANDNEIAKILQEAILAKLISIRNQRGRNLIVNFKSYLEIGSERIKNYDSMSSASYMRSEVWSRESELKSLVSVIDENGRSIIENNAAEITDLISRTQNDMLHIFNKSYEQFEHKMAVLRTLMTMQDTFHLLRFIDARGKKILESAVPVNKFFFSESEFPATLSAEIRDSVLQLTEIKLDNWKKRFEPILKDSVDNSTAFSAVNSQLKKNYNSLLETKTENYYENSKNIRESVRKLVSSTADLKIEEQNFIKKLQKIWFLCESEFENCHSLENHKNVVRALQIIDKGSIFSKVQQFSDQIMDIYESFYSGALKNPQYVLDISNLTNSLLQIQILFQRIKQSFKLPLPDLVEHGLDALEADTKRMECFYTDVVYYHEMKRFGKVSHNKQSLVPIISDLGNSISLSMLQYMYQNHVLIPFYQLDFPFAYEDAGDLEITADNYHTFKKEASTAIDRISSKIRRGPIIHRVAPAEKVGLIYSQVRELYRWKGEENEKTIENLLRGKPVTIKSDILKQNPNEQAIRIRNVNLELQTKNETLQKKLDKDLGYFAVNLEHSGVSYYKCRDNIFTFTHGRLLIHHSFATSSGYNRVDQNMVYSKLKDSDYIISPFTIWRLYITHRRNKNEAEHFEELEKYEHDIDIVLKAESIHLMDYDDKNLPFVPNSSSDYCNSKAMRKYYKNEDIIFQMNSTSDFAQELDITDLKTSHRNKRKVGHYGSTKIALENEVIENRELNYSSNMNFSNYQIPLKDKMPVLTISGADGRGGTDICSGFQYNLNDCLVLLNLILQRVTNSKESYSYFQDCAVNYSTVRQCALEIIRKFEESLQIFSKHYEEEEYSFDPVSLMEKLEQDIINNGGQNINGILLNAVSPRKNPVKETFFQRLWNKLAKIY